MVDTILNPEQSHSCNFLSEEETLIYYAIENYLSELYVEGNPSESERRKGLARANLGVYGKDEVYTRLETEGLVNNISTWFMNQHLAAEDPHNILPEVEKRAKNYVKLDGTTPFVLPQGGVDPTQSSHLTTRGFVERLLDNHLKVSDPHNVMELVREELKQYALASKVYRKCDVYTKDEVNDLIKGFVKKDGTTPFIAPQSGVNPISESHLTTKRYVDSLLFNHKVEIDPHGFLTLLNLKLANYYKTTETYSKVETYSRALLHLIINTLVCDAAQLVIKEHVNQFDPHNILREVYNEHYVKRDGSVPFISILKGIEGIEDDDLTTVSQLTRLKSELQEKIDKILPTWITSGPVLTTVGFVEDETLVPQTMTLQEIMDAIFYGKIVDVSSPALTAAGTTVRVNMFIRGNQFIEKAELFQDDVLIGEFHSEDFLEWEYSTMSLPIYKNTTFLFKVTFSNGSVLTASCVTNVAYGIFVGIIPEFCRAGDLTYDGLIDMTAADPENNEMYGIYDSSVTTIVHKFNFVSPVYKKKIALVIPKNYNQLDYMHTASQHFGIDAFDVQDIPLILPEKTEATIYTAYIYKEPLVALNSEVTFKLSEHE